MTPSYRHFAKKSTLLILVALLTLLLTLPCQGQGVSLNLVGVVKGVKHLHDKVPVTVKVRRITAALAVGASLGDMATTYRGIKRGFCELNPALQSTDGCSVNVARFTALKGGLILYMTVGEELLHKLPKAGPILDKESLILNSVVGIGYTVISIKNEAQK